MRITRVAHSIDLDATDVQLPDEGIPAEVVPLVKAVNSLLDRVQETREQQQFFLATAAHEIRTPLAIMRVRLEELEDVESREVLRNDARNLARLVEDLLRLLSVRNRGRPEGHVDLVELLRNVVAEQAPMAIENGIDVGMEAGDDSIVVNGDERLLSIALGNLIKNAISVSQPSGSVDVIVDEKGEILIRDHGPGVPADRRESIFEPFTKEPPNRKGHGLGLAIVKAIVSLHGGKVRVEDTAGGGATFVMKV
jgi:signal transduction histidine kinase